MPIRFLPNGKMFIPGGTISFAKCCCGGCPECCPGVDFGSKTLKMSITGIVFDGGAACDPACLPSVTDLPATGFVWFSAPPGPGTAVLAQMICSCGTFRIEDDSYLVLDAMGAIICAFTAGPGGFYLTGAACDPFYWEGDVPVAVFTPGGTYCGTASVHFIITE